MTEGKTANNDSEPKASAKKKAETKAKIAIIRIRSANRASGAVKDTLDMLKLHKRQYCSVYDKTASVEGMVKKVKDFVTWGEISEETYKMLVAKKGEKDSRDPEQIKPFFRMNSPKGGYEAKGIKVPFTMGGALGYRGEAINSLIEKML